MDGIILKQISVERNCVEYRFKVTGKLTQFFRTDVMFIDYEEDVSSVPLSILAIPFVASLIPIVWVTDTVMWVESLDYTFYKAVQDIREAYQRLYNHFPLKGNLVAARMPKNVYSPERETLLLFSGGLDANTTYVRIRQSNPVLFNIQGWYGKRGLFKKDAEADLHDISEFAKTEHREFTFAKSNFAVVVNSKIWEGEIQPKFGDSWWHGFQHSMAFLSIAIPIAFLRRIRTICIASSVPMGQYCMCASHVTTDSEFRFATVGECLHDGSELSRQDKVRTVVEYQRTLGRPYFLRVCSFNDKNCCECEKCFRTVLGLVAECCDPKDFQFFHNGTLKEHWDGIMKRRSYLMSFKSEKVLHWPYIIKRMKENYSKMNAEQKEFVDWFISFNFGANRRKVLWNYWCHNFGKLFVKKVKAFFKKS